MGLYCIGLEHGGAPGEIANAARLLRVSRSVLAHTSDFERE
jgi:hypothetical protein